MRVVGDSGPLIAAALAADPAHALAAEIVTELGRELIIPEPVVVEVDYLLRSRAGAYVARAFLESIRRTDHTVQFTSASLSRRAIQLEAAFADLDLGYADGIVMALAERERAPVLTFDFTHFRATHPERGFWRLVVDEKRYAEATR